MLYRDFGKTGLKVSAIGLGTWNIGNQWGEIDEDTALDTVQAALDHGVNIIDTAESYGIPCGLSEERLGRALKGKRDGVHIITKIGRWGRRSGQTVPMTTVDMVRLCVHASLYRLRTDYIDVLLCHEGKIEDPSLYLEAFELLKQQGTIGAYGISTDKPEVLERFNAQGTCSVVELDYSLLNRKPEKTMLPYCQENGIAVVARGPLGKGLLTGKYSTDTVFTDTVRSEWYATDRDREKLASKLAKVRRLKALVPPGEAMVRTAIQFVTAHECQPITIPGAKSPAQAVMNAQAGDGTLTPSDRTTLIKLLKGETVDAKLTAAV
ncbi:MAG: aldo/keto reductase [Cyanobacteria bacterium P01_A01_bin.70]